MAKKNCPCKRNGRECSSACHPGRGCTNIGMPLITESIDVDQVLTTENLPNTWLEVAGVCLTTKHSQMLDSVAWVDDSIISAAQGLLKMQNPHVDSLQLPFLATTMAFEPQSQEFVQILNINGNHWVTVSNIGCDRGHLNVYDSLHGKLPTETKKVVADLLQHTGNRLTLHYHNVQWQNGANDCGLFAIAFACALCSGENPANKIFEQNKMRVHLKRCFITGKMLQKG